MKKRTKASKKRLNNLLILLLLSAVLLVMSTYAWFTANRTVRIDTIDVNVATQGGLQISANGTDWKTVITKDDLIAADRNVTSIINQMPSLMSPVSSPIAVDSDGHLTMYYGKVETDLDTGNYTLTSTLQTDISSNTISDADLAANEYAKGYYVAFDFWLRLDSQDNPLYWSGKIVDNSENDGTGATGSDKGLGEAARVALIRGTQTSGFNSNTGALPNVVTALDTKGGTVTAWEPNVNVHNAYGVNNYNTLWATVGGAVQTWPTIIGTSIAADNTNGRLRYDALNGTFTRQQLGDAIVGSDAATGSPAALSVVTINQASASPATADSGTNQVLTTTKNQVPNFKFSNDLVHGITKFRAYLWVEGQDVDCENSASGTWLRYDLKFSLDAIND